MPIRITGMNSGLDTEAIITQLSSARSVKVNSLKKSQIKQKWTQEAWKDLNKKIFSFYSDTLSDLQYVGSYTKKTTTVSDTSKATVSTTGTAVNGTQYMSVQSLAKAGYLTSGELETSSGGSVSTSTKLSALGVDTSEGSLILNKGDGTTKEITLTQDSTVEDVVNQLKNAGLNAGFDAGQQRLYISATSTGEDSDFSILAGGGNGLQMLQKLGLNVDSDATRAAYQSLQDDLTSEYADADSYAQAMLEDKKTALEEEYHSAIDQYIKDNEIKDEDGNLLTDTDLSYEAKLTAIEAWTPEEGDKPDVPELETVDEEAFLDSAASYYEKITTADFSEDSSDSDFFGANGSKLDGSEAKITLNGVSYTSDTNNFVINGLSITAMEESEQNSDGSYKEFTLTTANDSSGIKDLIKNMFTKYNELVNEMSTLYNADANKGFEPLLSEEKAELSDTEIEEWEGKVKESLLRKDSTLSNVLNSMVEQMSKGYSVTMSDGTTQTMYLSSFGIDTLGYFGSEENERNAYHIDGDEDDTATSSKDDVLGYMIDTDPDAVSSFFSQLSKGLYSKMSDLMKSTTYSSAYTVYEDKLMRSEYSDYNDRITQAEDKLNDYLDSWYAKFSAMETAMANLNSKQSSLSGLFGG